MDDWDRMKAEAAKAQAAKTHISGTVIERYEVPPTPPSTMPAPIALIRDEATGQLVEMGLFGFSGPYIEVGIQLEAQAILVPGSKPDRKLATRTTGRRVVG